MAFQRPTNPQHQSMLLQLPNELLDTIVELALITPDPIINPGKSQSSRRPFTYFSTTSATTRNVPPLGSALLSICQILNLSISQRLLFNNELAFTQPSALLSFLTCTPSKHTRYIESLTLSLSETPLLPVSSSTGSYGTPASLLAREWTHLLSCPPPTAHVPGVWCAHLPTLSGCAPWLKHLRIDLEGCSRNTSAEMAFLGIKSGYASALEGMIAGLGKRAGQGSNMPGLGSGGRLKSLEITGKGAHLWDLGELLRPTILGEWETIERWIDLIGRRIIPHLLGAVGVSQPDNALKRVDSATAMNEKDKAPTICTEQELCQDLLQSSAQVSWVGMMWTKKRFSLVALDHVPSGRGVKGMGYKNMMSWEEIMWMTTARERFGHPVFALFV